MHAVQSSTTNNEGGYTPTSKKQAFPPRAAKPNRDEPLSTLLFNAHLQHTVKPPEKWSRAYHGVRRVEHVPDANLSNVRFADDILLISGSLKHTTTVLDDLTTATTAHGLQLLAMKKQNMSPNTTSTNTRSNNVAVMNIEILLQEGKIEYVGQLVTFRDAVQVEFDHPIKCA